MGQGTETCADRPTEVSVIRFVTRNRTIEEIAPKKEIYTCKQRGCGKVFTNQDEYKTHEALEALKIRFICREPGCGEELSDPGSMWRHYQEWHNNETSVYACPYTNCGSVHLTSSILEEHIESCHRQLPALPVEPEVICFESPEIVTDEEIAQKTDEGCYEKLPSDSFKPKEEYGNSDENCHIRNDGGKHPTAKADFPHEQSKITTVANSDDYTSNESLSDINKFSKNEDLLIIKDNFLRKYDASAAKCEEILQVECTPDKSNVVYISSDLTITKNMKTEICNLSLRNQEHRIDLGNFERVYRSSIERDNSSKVEDGSLETNSNCSDDEEEYTPKKQRMSRYKQETYKCDVNGCGKKYKYISHYRHHQDSHKLVTNTISSNAARQLPKVKQIKSSTVSFFICKMPGCGAQLNNVTGLWKHYQDNHANPKPPPVVQTPKNNEVFRCKVPGCEVEFSTTLMLYKHFDEVHSDSSIDSANGKTGNGGSFYFTDAFQEDATAQQANFKTDFKAKHNVNSNDCAESGDEQAARIANS